MGKLATLFILVLMFTSCVEEIPLEELENEMFIDDRNPAGTGEMDDEIAPELSNAQPSGTLPSSSVSTTLQVSTNEKSTCRYDVSIKDFEFMAQQLTSNNTGLSHMASMAVTNDTNYLFYIRCQDEKLNTSEALQVNFYVDKAGVQDTIAPIISGLAPNGELSPGTTMVDLVASTNEASNCRYSPNTGTRFGQMTPLASSNNLSFSASIRGLIDGASYQYSVQCQDIAGNLSSKVQVTFSIKELILDGNVLYANNCMSCHGDLGDSTKRNRTASIIQNAIDNNGTMKTLAYLQALTPAQVSKIAEVLYDAPEPMAPILNSAILSGDNYILSFSLPSGGLGAPQNGYDTFINDVDQNDSNAHTGFTRTITGLNKTQRQCFKLGALYSQLTPAISKISNELCVEPVAGDTTAPVISDVAPSGSLNATTTSIDLTLNTNEVANCRYSNSATANFSQMTPMQSSGSASHTQNISGLQGGQSYNYYFFCQDAAGNTSVKGISSFMIMELVLDGSQLYATNCMSCHNPLSNSTKKNRSALQIQNAIETNGQMKAISALQQLLPSQVAAIAEALSISTPPPSPEDNSSLTQKYVIGTRRYLTSKFTQIFYEQDQDISVKNVIDNNIAKNSEGVFGGNCTVADTDCEGHIQVISAGSMLPNSSPIRSATIHNVCQQILSRTTAINSALLRAGLSIASSGNDNANITSVFDVFFPGVPISQEALGDLKTIFTEAKANGLSNNNAWKMVMDPMCKSSLFEVY